MITTSLKNYDVYYSPSEYFDEIDIEKESLEQHKKYDYYECPVWKHHINRIFIVKSPVDFELKFNKTEKYLIEYKIGNEETKTINFKTDNIEFFACSLSDLMNKNPVIQVEFTNTYFWTSSELKYVWFEFLDHPMTALKNNFIPICGWFNIANHPRGTSLAIKVIDVDKPVSIKKGDPLYRVRFYTDDLNDMPVLIKKEPQEFSENLMNENIDKISENRKLLTSTLFEKTNV